MLPSAAQRIPMRTGLKSFGVGNRVHAEWRLGGSLRHEFALPATPLAASIARTTLKRTIPPPTLKDEGGDAMLVLSEVITNAVKYGAEAGEPIHLVIESDDLKLWISVQQPLPSFDTELADPRLEGDVGGFGLHIVDALADRWGTDPGPPGRVWFEFDL